MLRKNVFLQLLKFTYGLVFVVVGVDKFFGFLTDWTQYISPLITDTVGVDPGAFLGLVGMIEIALGILLLTKWTKKAAYAAAVWMLFVVVNLISTGQFLDVAGRDVLIAVALFTLGGLSDQEGQKKHNKTKNQTPGKKTSRMESSNT